MKENIKVGEKWVYVKCSVCGHKKDFSIEAFNKKKGNLTSERFAELFICKSCLKNSSSKQKPTTEQIDKLQEVLVDNGEAKPTTNKTDSKPYTKERQLGKKEKKTVLPKEDDEDFFAK